MSLINDALKKAQRQRAAAEGSVTPPAGQVSPAGRPGKRSRAMPAQTLLLIVSGAAVLVVASVVATVFLLSPSSTPPAPEKPAQATAETPPAEKIAVADPSPAPVVTLPEITPPEPTPIQPAVVKAQPEPTPPETKPESVAPKPEPVPNEKAYAFIDKLQVMGIRSSGSDSKVLMNDRVFRINDIVDRTLGLKLVKVAPDTLTFVDPAGAVYTKNF